MELRELHRTAIPLHSGFWIFLPLELWFAGGWFVDYYPLSIKILNV